MSTSAYGVTLTLAVTFAQACLLLVTPGRHRINAALWAIVAGMIVDGSGFDGTYGRLFGVVAILTAIGPMPTSTPLSERVAVLARQEGISVDALVSRALDAYEGRVTARES
ncbi:MAG: hypothetical protein QM655_10720 [Nocardioidaceae bacterium]